MFKIMAEPSRGLVVDAALIVAEVFFWLRIKINLMGACKFNGFPPP